MSITEEHVVNPLVLRSTVLAESADEAVAKANRALRDYPPTEDYSAIAAFPEVWTGEEIALSMRDRDTRGLEDMFNVLIAVPGMDDTDDGETAAIDDLAPALGTLTREAWGDRLYAQHYVHTSSQYEWDAVRGEDPMAAVFGLHMAAQYLTAVVRAPNLEDADDRTLSLLRDTAGAVTKRLDEVLRRL